MKKYIPGHYKELLFHTAVLPVLLAVCLFPFFYVLFYFYSSQQELSELQYRLDTLHKKAASWEGRQRKEEKVLAQLKRADPFYLDKYVESLVFLEAEMHKWQQLPDDSELKNFARQRLDFLTGGKNRLQFVEGQLNKNDLFQETEERQKNPVEMNEEDLKKTLSCLEGVRIHPYYPQEFQPHIVITSFDLTKKSLAESKEKVFVISMQLMKRELKNKD